MWRNYLRSANTAAPNLKLRNAWLGRSRDTPVWLRSPFCASIVIQVTSLWQNYRNPFWRILLCVGQSLTAVCTHTVPRKSEIPLTHTSICKWLVTNIWWILSNFCLATRWYNFKVLYQTPTRLDSQKVKVKGSQNCRGCLALFHSRSCPDTDPNYQVTSLYLLKEGQCFARQKRVLPIHYLPESNPKNLPATNLSPLENCLYWFSEPNNCLRQCKTLSLIVDGPLLINQ